MLEVLVWVHRPELLVFPFCAEAQMVYFERVVIRVMRFSLSLSQYFPLVVRVKNENSGHSVELNEANKTAALFGVELGSNSAHHFSSCDIFVLRGFSANDSSVLSHSMLAQASHEVRLHFVSQPINNSQSD